MLTPRCLVVEDDPRLRTSLVEQLAAHVGTVYGAGTVAEALACLPQVDPTLILADFQLPDGTAFDLLDAMSTRSPRPTLVVMSGRAAPGDGFELAARGARAYVEKPVDARALLDALEDALANPPDLAPHLRSAVGRVGLREVEELTRRTMIEEALSREQGNRRGAARLLRVSRQLLQHALRALDG